MTDVIQASERDLPAEQSRAIAALVREELARRRLSRQGLADQAKISVSTLEKALSGRRPFTLMTAIRLEEALGVRLRRVEIQADARTVVERGFAPDYLGAYSRPAMMWIEGGYLTLRPSFGDAAAIYAYRTDIVWEPASSRMIFEERERIDAAFTQYGEVAAPHQSGHIYLVTNRHGQHRMIILGRPTIDGAMYGILTTLQAGRGSQLTPVAAPIAFVPLADGFASTTAGIAAGRITAADPGYAACRAHLARVTEDAFAILL